MYTTHYISILIYYIEKQKIREKKEFCSKFNEFYITIHKYISFLKKKRNESSIVNSSNVCA